MLVKIDGKTLIRLRKQRNYTQAYLANEAGISQQTLAFYENGKILSCKEETVAKLAVALGVDVNSLVFDIKTMTPEMYHGEKELSPEIKNVLDPLSDFKMNERVCSILHYLAGFSDHQRIYHERMNLYYIIGDYFVNREMVSFTSKIAQRERYWSSIIGKLQGNTDNIHQDLANTFRIYRVKNSKKRRNLLVYTYYLLLENCRELPSGKKNENTLLNLYSAIALICNLLEDASTYSAEDMERFCEGSLKLLEKCIMNVKP